MKVLYSCAGATACVALGWMASLSLQKGNHGESSQESAKPAPAVTVAVAATPAPSPASFPAPAAATEVKGPPQSVVQAAELKLLFVVAPGTTAATGFASKLFATRETPGAKPIDLVTEVGPSMKKSFEEAVRYVQKSPRQWEKEYSIRMSFEDKFSEKDGGSAGAAFTVVMSSVVQGFGLSPDVTMTGDITIDGAIQPVGAITEKIRGAIAAKCKLTAVPLRNARDVEDMVLLDGTPPLWETQIFSINTVSESISLASIKRPENIVLAMERFDRLRARLPAVVTPNYLQSPIVISELKEISKLAPNHLSASILLRASEDKLAKELTFGRSVDEILGQCNLFVGPILSEEDSGKGSGLSSRNHITVFPQHEYVECLKKLTEISPMLDKRSIDLKAACIDYIGALASAMTDRSRNPFRSNARTYTYTYTNSSAPAEPSPKFRTESEYHDYLAEREAYLQKQQRLMEQQQMLTQVQQYRSAQEQRFNSEAVERLDSTRSQLLLAIRKLRMDSSILAETLRK